MDKPQPGSLPQEIEDVLRQFRSRHLQSPAHNLQLNEEFTEKLMEVCNSVFESPNLSPNLASELRYGFGNAMGAKLVDWVWESLAPSFKPGTGPTPTADLIVECPSDRREELTKTVERLSYDFLEKTGVSLPGAQFRDGSEVTVFFRSQLLHSEPEDAPEASIQAGFLRALLMYADRFLTAQQIKQKLLNLWGQKPELLQMYDEERVGLAATSRVLRHLLQSGYPIWEFDLIIESIITNFKLSTIEEFSFDVERDMSEVLRSKRFTGSESNDKRPGDPTFLGYAPIRLELGIQAFSLTGNEREETLRDRITSLRRSINFDMGWLPPDVQVLSNSKLPPEGFRILVREKRVASGRVWPNLSMAMAPPELLQQLQGIQAKDPAFHNSVVWIENEERETAEALGCAVFSSLCVLAMSLTKTLREQAHELFTVQNVQDALEELRPTEPSLVKIVDARPDLLLKAKEVFSRLLEEQVAVVDKLRILDTVCRVDNSGLSSYYLTEMVREDSSHIVCRDLVDLDGTLPALRLSPEIQELCQEKLRENGDEAFLDLDTEQYSKLATQLTYDWGIQKLQGVFPVLIVEPRLRKPLQRICQTVSSALFVLSDPQIPSDVEILELGNLVINEELTPEMLGLPNPRRVSSRFRTIRDFP